MDELISRQAAINVIERMRAYIGHNMERAVGAAFIEILNCVGEDIGRLPSIQLATDTNVGAKLGTNLAEVGMDCISRQSAIGLVDGWFKRIGLNGDICLDGLRTLPSVQPKRGKWIKTARWGRVYYCDQCRNYLDFDGVNAGRGSTNFCPNCGADMRGERDG